MRTEPEIRDLLRAMTCAAADMEANSDGQVMAVNIVHALQWVLEKESSPAFAVMVQEAKGFLARRAARSN